MGIKYMEYQGTNLVSDVEELYAKILPRAM